MDRDSPAIPDVESPIQNLEKLIEDLHREREKCQQLSKANIQLMKEVQSRDEIIKNSKLSLSDRKSKINELEEIIDKLSIENNQWENNLYEIQSKLSSKESDIMELKKDMNDLNELIHTLRAEITMKDGIITTLHEKILDVDSFQQNHRNNGVLLNGKTIMDGHRDGNYESSNSSSHIKEEDNHDDFHSDHINDLLNRLNESQQRFEELSQDYDITVVENNQLKQKLSDTNYELTCIKSNSKQSEVIILELKKENERIGESLMDAKTSYERNEKIFMEEQEIRLKVQDELVTMRTQYEDVKILFDRLIYEKEELITTIENHRKIISQYKERICQLEEEKADFMKQLTNVSHSPTKMSKQIDDIRDKMSILNHQLRHSSNSSSISREEFIYTATDLTEREQQLREVYESVIQDLHDEILKNANTEFNMNTQLTSDTIAKCKELEIENTEYEQSTHRLGTEAISITVTAMEAFERNSNLQQRNHRLMKILLDTKVAYGKLEEEFHDYDKDMEEERTKLYSKLNELEDFKTTVEKEREDYHNSNQKMESERDELLEKNNAWQLYCNQVQKSMEELESDYESLQQLKENQDKHIQKLESQSDHLKGIETMLSNSQQEKEKYMTEVNILTKRNKLLESKKLDIEHQMRELEAKIMSLQHQNDKYRIEIAKLTEELTNQHLKDLQSETDLVSTNVILQEKLEKEKSIRKKQLMNLEMSLLKEKETGNLLRTQKKVLEERLVIVLQELLSYRSLDLHHISFEKELDHFRKSTSPI